MGIGYLGVLALDGNVFITKFSLTRVQVPRWAGYEMLFACGVTGALLLGLPLPLVWYLKQLSEDICPGNIGFLTAAGVLGIPFAWLLAYLLNFPAERSRKKRVRELAASDGNLIEVLLCDAIEQKWSIEVSLESDKSYVGLPLRTSFPSQGIAKDIELVPVLSGHRDKKTQSLKLDRFYGNHFLELLDKGYKRRGQTVKVTDFKVVIPTRQIVSARLFDIGIHRRMNRDQDPIS